jgi:choline dehydrogenase-like flavoprotein
MTDFDSRTLHALLDCLIPPDEFPGAVEAGVPDYLARQFRGDLSHMVGFVASGLRSLEAEARAAGQGAFHEMSLPDQTQLLRTVEEGRVRTTWEIAPGEFVATMANYAAEGYYSDPGNGGNLGEVSWRAIGYSRKRPATEPDLPAVPVLPGTPPMPSPTGEFDVVIVGAGVGGGIVAGKLAEAGMRVLLIERGRQFAKLADVPHDHLRNHRVSLYGNNTDPTLDGVPRVWIDKQGTRHVRRPHEPGYQNNAMTVGGGSLVYGMQAWRFLPDDFRMASRYGVPEGSSLADWPITYEDLAPYYEQAEWEIGVAGDAAGHKEKGERGRPYPLPPVRDNPTRLTLQKGAARLGLHCGPVPLAMNTVPRDGRGACVECGECVGFSCPTNAKAGSFNTLLPRAFATGLCTLVTEAQAEKVQTDAAGRVTGVSYFTEENGVIQRHEARARVVVLAAGAVESARLLLLSANDHEPCGLGNNSDQVGRHLQGHDYPTAYGIFPEPIPVYGPGPSISTCDYNHGNEGIVGGSMLANEFEVLPIIYWRGQLPPGTPRWGLENKRFVRRNYSRTQAVTGPVQEIPSPDGRVTLDPEVKDRFGLPVPRFSGTQHPETVRTSEFMRHKSEEWLRASGAEHVWSYPPENRLSGGQHQAGTCRMGNDPQTSVTDALARVHGHDNLYIADASLHVTNGGFNPVLTVMALAFRVADTIVRGGARSRR